MAKAADEFLRQCDGSEQLPDVFEFLASNEGLSERAQVDVLLVDQFQRWKLNQIIPVDQYLDRTPDISDVLKVELLIEEYGYLEQRGIAPTAEEFAKRYSSLSSDARTELYEALEIQSVGDFDSDQSADGSSSGSSSKQTPEFIGRYQVVRMLGKGAFGKVFLAKDPDLDRSVAIKVPTSERVKRGGGVEEFLNEARAVAKLDHPNIVPVYDVGITDDKRCFVVSKYVRGKELRAELRRGISHRESAWIVGSLARALHAAHVAGIVHRDVKPGNVIVDSKRKPHLLDFGLAFQDQDDFDNDALVGTPAYMSPEQAEGGSRRVDGRSDIYSLAVVFYELLAGHRPCKSDDTDEVLAQLKQGAVRPPRQSDDTIPVELEQICLKALSRELSDRYNTAKDMADEIETWLLETSTGDDSIGPMGGTLGSSDSNRSSRSSRRMVALQSDKSPLAAFFTSPATIVGGIVLIGLTAIIAFTNPPWKVPGSVAAPSTTNSSADQPDADVVVPESLFPRRIAVLGFRNLSAEPDASQFAWLNTGLSELLTEELQKSEQLSLVTSENVSLMKTDLDLSDADSLGSSALTRIRNRVDADWVLLGSFQPIGDRDESIRFNVTAQETSGRNSKIQFSNTVPREHWLDLLPLSSAQLRRKLSLKAPNLVATGTAFPSSPNLAAAKQYFEGIGQLRKFDPLTARTSFESAAAKDPESAQIQDAIAQSFRLLGDERQAREFSARAVDLCGALPQHQQLAIKGRHCLLTGKPHQAVVNFRLLFEARNEAVDELLLLASAMTTAGQGRDALAMLEDARTTKTLLGAAKVRVDLESAKAAQAVSDFAKQVEFSQSAYELSKSLGARTLEGQASLLEGIGLGRLSKHGEALVCFERAVKSFDKIGDQRNRAAAIASWAKTLIDNGQLDLAEKKIKEGMKLSESLSNQRLIAKHKSLKGEVAVYRGNLDDATKLLQEALVGYTELGNWQEIASMNLILCNVFARTGKLDQALEMVAAARKAYQACGNRLAEGRTWGQEGAMRARAGDSIEAQRYFVRALELFREVGDQRSVAICLGDLASTHSNRGQLTKAGELYSDALELHRQIGSKRGPEMVMFNLANLYARTGRFDEAQRLMTESLERFKKLNAGLDTGFVERKLADTQLKRGDLASAKEAVSGSLTGAKESGNLAVEAQSLYSMHHIAVFEGDLENAIRHIKESQEKSRELKQELRIALCDFALAYIALQQRDAASAVELLQRSETKLVSLQPKLKPMLLFVRTRATANAGKLTDAKAIFQKAEDSGAENATEDVTVLLSRRHERALALQAIGELDKAAQELATVIKLAGKYGWLALKWEATLQSFEWLHAAEQDVSVDAVADLRKAVSEAGFVAFASRLEALQGHAAND